VDKGKITLDGRCYSFNRITGSNLYLSTIPCKFVCSAFGCRTSLFYIEVGRAGAIHDVAQSSTTNTHPPSSLSNAPRSSCPLVKRIEPYQFSGQGIGTGIHESGRYIHPGSRWIINNGIEDGTAVNRRIGWIIVRPAQFDDPSLARSKYLSVDATMRTLEILLKLIEATHPIH